MKKNDLPEWLSKASYRIIEHMNDDHSNSIVSTLNAQHGIKDKKAKMEAIKAYLEAKKIKQEYILDDLDSSDVEDLEEFSE